MKNIIAFPKDRARQPAPRAIEGATLFIHVRKATLIAHLARPLAARNEMTGRQSKA
jgi:hypothetical protein